MIFSKFLLKNGFFFIFFSILVTVSACKNKVHKKTKEENTLTASYDSNIVVKKIKTTNKDLKISTIAVGDIMLGTNYPSKKYLPATNNCTPLLADVKEILQDADITFGNLEGCFNDNAQITKNCSNPAVCYAFRTPESYFNCLIEVGFDLFSLANNHIGDCGDAGKKSTQNLIENSNTFFAGLLYKKTSIFEKKGLKIGFCGFAPNTGTCDLRDIPEMQKTIKQLNDSCDIVIVSFHGGAEGSKHKHIKCQTEWYVEENRGNIYEITHKMIDAGADLVLGHGPHIPRAIELYKNRLIAYSLGNFCTYSRINIKGISGYAPILKVNLNAQGEFLDGKIFSAVQEKNVGTKKDSLNRAAQLIKELTEKDFPETQLTITQTGKITKL